MKYIYSFVPFMVIHPSAAVIASEVLVGFPCLRNGRIGFYAGPAEQAPLGTNGRLYFLAGMIALGVV